MSSTQLASADSDFMGEHDESKIEGHDHGKTDEIACGATRPQPVGSDSPAMAFASESDFGGAALARAYPYPLMILSWPECAE